MIVLFPNILLLGISVFLFVREIELDKKRFLKQKKLANEKFLREVERFLKEKSMEKLN